MAAHTPTSIRLTDSFYNLLTFSYNDASGLPVNPSEPTSSPDGTFTYKLKTPFRAMGSFAYIFGRKGFLTGEVEFVDYSQNQFELTLNDNSAPIQQYERLLNADIQALLATAVNIRIGGEYVFGQCQARAGVGILSNPIQGQNGINTTYSVGFGYRPQSYYFDLAYRLFSYNEAYVPYNLVDESKEPNVGIEGLSHQIAATIGFRF